MFKRKEEVMPQSDYKAGETVIAHGVKVEGDFTSEGDVVIEGEVAGTVKTAAGLKVGEAARIQADVEAVNASIAGEVRGNLKIGDRLELTESSQVHGDIEARVLSVAPGAKVNGRITMDGASAAEAAKPAEEKESE